MSLEDAIGRYIAKVDPKGEFTRKRTQQDELAKEGRKEKTTIAAEVVRQKQQQKKQQRADYHSYSNV